MAARFSCHHCGEELHNLSIEVSGRRTSYESGSYQDYYDLEDQVRTVDGEEQLELSRASDFAYEHDLLYEIDDWECHDTDSTEVDEAYWCCPECGQRSAHVLWDEDRRFDKGLVEAKFGDDTDQLLRELEALKAKLALRSG